MDEIDPTLFIAGLRWQASSIRERGVRDITIKRGADWFMLRWQEDEACIGMAETVTLASTLESIAFELETAGIRDITKFQECQAEKQNGHYYMTGQRSLFARWKWNSNSK